MAEINMVVSVELSVTQGIRGKLNSIIMTLHCRVTFVKICPIGGTRVLEWHTTKIAGR